MRIENEQLKNLILDSSLVEPATLEESFKESQRDGIDLGDILLHKQLISEESLRKLYSYILGIPFVDLEKKVIEQDVLRIIPEPVAKKRNVVVFEKTPVSVKVAMLNPDDIQTIDFIKKKTGLNVISCLASEAGMKVALRQYERSLKAEFGEMVDDEQEIKVEAESSGEVVDVEKASQEVSVVQVVDTLIKHAILQQASDIHIEPMEKDAIVRYRIDGILHDAMFLPKKIMPGIIARIKVLANLKIDEHRLPQDGRFKVEKDDYRIAFRVSILPVFDGEKVVMRLLDESSKNLTLKKMGFLSRDLEVVEREVKKPNGMILVTGPTGSGKTTTLYTVLDMLNTHDVNISTVEDPVEYRMQRVNQTQVNAKIGMTFAAALRSLLRQDPDIIMVGEIRDNETMEIAIHAAMTGHLVLSTIHTNSAAATIPRLLDMGAEPFLVASTINVIIAQRLVRKVCGDCKKSYQLDKKQLDGLSGAFDQKVILERIREQPQFVDTVKKWEDIVFYRAEGCAQCGNEGYKGRMGIYEVLEMTEKVEKMVTSKATAEEIEQQARWDGMHTMIEDGMIKAALGYTSIEEILRVTKD